MMAQKRIFFRRILLIGVVGVVLWVAGFALFIRYIESLSSSDPAKAATDAIVVLTGGAQRINAGLDLLAAGRAQKLFISGVGGNVSLKDLFSLWQRPIIVTGKESCCIVLGREARNTAENAKETAQWAARENIKSIRLVTSDYHMPRALLEFRQALPGMTILPHPIGASADPADFQRKIFSEYNKTILACIRTAILP